MGNLVKKKKIFPVFEEVKKEINKTNQDSIIKKNIKPIE